MLNKCAAGKKKWNFPNNGLTNYHELDVLQSNCNEKKTRNNKNEKHMKLQLWKGFSHLFGCGVYRKTVRKKKINVKMSEHLAMTVVFSNLINLTQTYYIFGVICIHVKCELAIVLECCFYSLQRFMLSFFHMRIENFHF